MGAVLYARFVPVTFAWLALWTLVIALLASLYPAWFAARLEPVDALHSS
jgi:ABC-type lipoprotein release transport system permease subunit